MSRKRTADNDESINVPPSLRSDLCDGEEVLGGDADDIPEVVVESSDELESNDEDEYITEYQPFRPGIDTVGSDEELVMDQTAYDTFHQFSLSWPCLSFDYISPPMDLPPSLVGPKKIQFVAGTQAAGAESSDNALFVVTCENVCRTQHQNNSDDSDSDSDDDENEPRMSHFHIKSEAAFNKVVVCPKANRFVGALCDNGAVCVYDIESVLNAFNTNAISSLRHDMKPLYEQHFSTEGFAMEWSPDNANFMVGLRDNIARLFTMAAGGWELGTEFKGHTGAVEALSFHKGSPNVFATGSSDSCIRLWDSRTTTCSLIVENAHEGDVNALSFRPVEEPNHLLSGGDDGKIYIRDIRFPTTPLADFSYHKQPICCLDWSLHDGTSFLAGSFDNRVTVWDTSLEAEGAQSMIEGIPPQLVFEHCGHRMLSYAKFHPTLSYMLMSTGADEFNIWRPSNLYEFAERLEGSI